MIGVSGTSLMVGGFWSDYRETNDKENPSFTYYDEQYLSWQSDCCLEFVCCVIDVSRIQMNRKNNKSKRGLYIISNLSIDQNVFTHILKGPQ